MKNITLGQIKADVYNPITVVEESVEIDPKALHKNYTESKSLISDLEGLKEALYFKSEKLKKKLSSSKDSKSIDAMKDIESFVNKLRIQPLDNSKALLERNKEILELKTVQKILKYSLEINVSGDQVLEGLLNSEVKQDWIFLAELLYYSLKFGDSSKTKLLLLYSKKVEEQMVSVFQTSLASNDLSTCKIAFTTLTQLDKETLLLDQYLFSSDLIKSDIETEPPLISTIDLDEYDIKDDSFDVFIQRIVDALDADSSKFVAIFGSEPKYNDYLFTRLFRTVVFRNLEKYLSISNPALFLICLMKAYRRLEYLGHFIKQQYSGFEPDPYINEGFAQHLTKAIQKEKQFFDEIFDILVYDAKTINKYILLGETVTYSENHKTNFEKILCVINLMEERKPLFYTNEEEKDLLKYFYRKTISLAEKIVSKVPDKIKAINDLSYIYMLSRKYFNENFKILEEFSEKIDSLIQEAFEAKIDSVLNLIKPKIANLYFFKDKDFASILSLIKSSIKEGEPLKGKNYITYSIRILDEIQQKLYKQILGIVFSKEQSPILVKSVDDFVGYVALSNCGDVVRKCRHMKMIVKLITCQTNQFMIIYNEYKDSISEKELKDLIKCRKDREEIKSMLTKKAGK